VRFGKLVPGAAGLAALLLVVAVFLSLLGTEPVSSINLTKQDLAIVQRHNIFGFNLFRQLYRDGGNVFISPTSIAIALSMTYNGAQGETKLAMAKALSIEDILLEDVNVASEKMLALLQSPDPHAELLVANSIWARKGVEFKEKFLQDNEQFYNARIEVLRFDDQALKAINDWVSSNTKGRIPTILDQIDPSHIMFLVNAIYFEGEWSLPFNPELTKELEFTLRNGTKKMHPMMTMTNAEELPYLETSQFQAIRLPYGESGRLGMYVFLPQDIDEFIQDLTIENWNSWISKFHEQEVSVVLPKIRLEYSKRLNEALKTLGMEIAFTPAADFGRMVEGEAWIDFVDHKTFLEIDEKGTKAAAATVVAIMRSSRFHVRVNRPFLFAIVDNESASIIFMGLIENPTLD
jgi:serine protease inhibitor